MAGDSYTNVNWVAMGEASKLLNAQSGRSVDQVKAIQGLHEEAATAWTGRSGDTWRQAVDDWIAGFNKVIDNLNNIRTTLDNEIQFHEQSENDNVGTANNIVMPAV